jgi:hypothetical protein
VNYIYNKGTPLENYFLKASKYQFSRNYNDAATWLIRKYVFRICIVILSQVILVGE